jgi:hypothetical protein
MEKERDRVLEYIIDKMELLEELYEESLERRIGN